MDKEGKKLTNKNHVSLFPIAECWRVDNLIGNNIIQNTIIRNRFCEILQNLHFADNMYDDKTDRGFKVRPVIDHLNKRFAEVLSNKKEKSIDEHTKNIFLFFFISKLMSAFSLGLDKLV